jgi:glyoxylase-like metal-dependent hydrolase (beta-lactamase superfamily II)
MLVFRQLFDKSSSTYTYLLGDHVTGEAVLIDPVFEQIGRDTALLRELSLSLKFVVDTHCHADHITAAWLLRDKESCDIGVSCKAGVTGATEYFNDSDVISFGHHSLRVLLTPGHTEGCATFVLDDMAMAFTGDAILIRGCGRTDFQGGDPSVLYQSVHEKIFTLPPTTILYPGHDYNGLSSTSVAEERNYNPRLGGTMSEEDFSRCMNNLGLAYPERLDVALPANLACGEPIWWGQLI